MLTPTQRETLQRLERRQRSSQQLVRRVRIVLEAAFGASNTRIAGLLGIDRGQVRTWRKRWLECQPRLIAAEEKAKEEAKEKLFEGLFGKDTTKTNNPADSSKKNNDPGIKDKIKNIFNRPKKPAVDTTKKG